MVATVGPVPGIPNRIPGIDPPVCTTECMDSKKASPRNGFMPKTKGIKRASPTLPPNPGIAPKKFPRNVANSIKPKTSQVIVCWSPLNIASIILGFPSIS